MAKQSKSFWQNNSLSVVFLLLTIVTLFGQSISGWLEHNEYLKEHKASEIDFGSYFSSGHFLQSTFENWESEFLQMALFVILTAFLMQKGSSESLGPDDPSFNPDDLKANRYSPWPVKRGGAWLWMYKYSLSIALTCLFLVSFVVHWYGSWKDYNQEQMLKGGLGSDFLPYLGDKKFWFESFQNWQSEFLSVFVIVYLSIYLRQWGSPQSKPVNMASDQNKPE